MILAASVLIFLAFAVFVLSPFFVGRSGLLETASVINDVGLLKQMKEEILVAFIKDEADFNGKHISKREWAQRQKFLCNRYIDIVRRLDYLAFSQH